MRFPTPNATVVGWTVLLNSMLLPPIFRNPAAAETVLIEATGSASVSGSVEEGETTQRFLLPMRSADKPLMFDARLGTLQFSTLGITATLADDVFVSSPPPSHGTISTTDYSVGFPTLGPDFTFTGSSGAFCPGESGCSTGTVTGTPINSQNSTADAPIDPFIGGTVSASTTVDQASITGHYTLTLSADQQVGYKPFSKDEYLRHFLAENSLGNSPTVDQLQHLVDDIKTLRESDAQTSGSNLNLRDLEYFVRGRIGGRLLRTGQFDFSSVGTAFDDVANATSPVSAAIYIGKKYVDIGLGRNTAGASQLPNTPPGGYGANVQGFSSGLRNVPLDQINLDEDGALPSTPSSNPSAPLQPILGSAPNASVFYVAGQQAGTTYYFDPSAGDYLSIGAQGNLILGFILNSPVFQTPLVLYVGDKKFQYVPGESLNFEELLGSATLGFSLFGFPASVKGQEVTFGLSFANTGDETVVAALTGNVPPVPVPSSIFLLASSLGALGLVRRMRR